MLKESFIVYLPTSGILGAGDSVMVIFSVRR